MELRELKIILPYSLSGYIHTLREVIATASCDAVTEVYEYDTRF